MDIARQKSDTLLVLRLVGRLDANWCNHLQNALTAAIREGEHRIHLDMADVIYVSSAGLRVLLTVYKQLRAINGVFGVSRASAAVQSVLELAGLDMLLTKRDEPTVAANEEGRAHTSASARYEIFSNQTATAEMDLTKIGDPLALRGAVDPSQILAREFGAKEIALGVGALGGSFADCAPRFGEFLAVAGVAAFQPTDNSSRPDFAVSQSAFVPEGRLLVGLAGQGTFPTLARFEATAEARTLSLAELAQTALDLSGANTAVFVAVTETAGLVGASLRRSPAFAEPTAGRPASAVPAGVSPATSSVPVGANEAAGRFSFPQIRDWLSFTSERAFRDSTSLLVGVVSKPGSSVDSLLRPLEAGSPLLAHIHAAAFPYRPLRKGRIDLKASVNELFEGQALQAVLHLLADPREFNGAGQSEFFRGAVWIAGVKP